jgi:hypothetical protein
LVASPPWVEPGWTTMFPRKSAGEEWPLGNTIRFGLPQKA